MLRLPMVFACMVLAVTAAGVACGQHPLAGGHTAPPGVEMKKTAAMQSTDPVISAGLLFRPQVQKELGLSDEQKEKIREQCSRPPVAGMPGVRDEAVERAAEILKPEQFQRLREISAQSLGVLAFRPLAKELGITDEQLKKLRQRYNKRISEQDPLAEGCAHWVQVRRILMQDALEVLTPEQRKKFEKMTGKKIDPAVFYGPLGGPNNDPRIQQRPVRSDEALIRAHFKVMANPDDAEACYQLGLLYASYGRTEEAVHQFRKAIAIKPDYEEARKALDQALGTKEKGP
jgi:tetratricopeptide (TPR) repeat protein